MRGTYIYLVAQGKEGSRSHSQPAHFIPNPSSYPVIPESLVNLLTSLHAQCFNLPSPACIVFLPPTNVTVQSPYFCQSVLKQRMCTPESPNSLNRLTDRDSYSHHWSSHHSIQPLLSLWPSHSTDLEAGLGSSESGAPGFERCSYSSRPLLFCPLMLLSHNRH